MTNDFHYYFFYFRQTWEKVDIVENDNGTMSYNQKRVYIFNEELSNGSEDDVVIVPNIPMLSATSQSKHAARLVQKKTLFHYIIKNVLFSFCCLLFNFVFIYVWL